MKSITTVSVETLAELPDALASAVDADKIPMFVVGDLTVMRTADLKEVPQVLGAAGLFEEESHPKQDALKLTARDIESLSKMVKQSPIVMLPMVVGSENAEHRIWERT